MFLDVIKLLNFAIRSGLVCLSNVQKYGVYSLEAHRYINWGFLLTFLFFFLLPTITLNMDSRYTHNNNTDLNGSAYSLPLPSPSSSECSNSFSFESNNVVSSTYYQHSQSSEVETTGASKPKPKKTYTCSYCKKVFTRPSALQTHTYTHTAEKPFQCSRYD